MAQARNRRRLLLLRHAARTADSAASHRQRSPRPDLDLHRMRRHGASIWWPNKDQWRDEVENMKSASRFPTAWWTFPTASSSARPTWATATRAGTGGALSHQQLRRLAQHRQLWQFSDKLGDVPLDFYVLPEDLDKAKKQFVQAKGMLEAFQHYFGEYPFKKDGYKLVEVPYSRHGAPERGHLRQPFRQRLPGAAIGRRGHQPEIRLHHHP